MILVKRRGDLASLIVARLYAEGVPVAGVDRLRLNAPLAVQDLLAAIRFVLQPDDDLSLAALLVSPLIGWTQDELMHAAPRASGSLVAASDARRRPTSGSRRLRDMLARADFATPYQFLEEMLSGAARRAAQAVAAAGRGGARSDRGIAQRRAGFRATATPSLQRFLDWFDRGDVEIVRDAAGAARCGAGDDGAWRQGPAGAGGDSGRCDASIPTRRRARSLRWRAGAGRAADPGLPPRAAERGGPLDEVVDAAEQRELQEHWRLFYVAATRAEERLVIAGSLGPPRQGRAARNELVRRGRAGIRCAGCRAARAQRVFTRHASACRRSRRSEARRRCRPSPDAARLGAAARRRRRRVRRARSRPRRSARMPWPIRRRRRRCAPRRSAGAAPRAVRTAAGGRAGRARDGGRSLAGARRAASRMPASARRSPATVCAGPRRSALRRPVRTRLAGRSADRGGDRGRAGGRGHGRPAARRGRPRPRHRLQDRAAVPAVLDRCRPITCARWRPMPRRSA